MSGLTLNIGFDALVRQDASAVDVNLVAYRDIITKDSDVFKASPATDS